MLKKITFKADPEHSAPGLEFVSSLFADQHSLDKSFVHNLDALKHSSPFYTAKRASLHIDEINSSK